jgi:hypothetical protein
MTSSLLDPTGASAEREASLSRRDLTTLDGKTIGLLNNTKVKADYILDAVESLLRERYAVKDVVRVTKETFSRPMSDEIARDMASRCDVVVTAIGS